MACGLLRPLAAPWVCALVCIRTTGSTAAVTGDSTPPSFSSPIRAVARCSSHIAHSRPVYHSNMSATPQKRMQYVRLGNSGLKVSRIIMGTMQYGNRSWGLPWVLDEEEAVKHIKYAYDHGITTFDTADIYCNGYSEIILGNVIKRLNLPREELVIMTKIWSPINPKHDVDITYTGQPPENFGVINQYGLSRKHIFDAVKDCLKRLQLDYIDVLQCHRFDANTPIAETMQALHDVVQAGYVRYIGMSSCYAYQFHAMQNYAITNKLTPFISMQNHYNLVYREEEREMYPTLKMFGVGSIPWSPLARGVLTRPWKESSESKTTRSQFDPWSHGYVGEGTQEIVSRVEQIAKKKGLSMAQVSLAWVLSKDHVTAPIVGSTKLENLQEALDAMEVQLTEDEITYLEAAYKPTAIFGHW